MKSLLAKIKYGMKQFDMIFIVVVVGFSVALFSEEYLWGFMNVLDKLANIIIHHSVS